LKAGYEVGLATHGVLENFVEENGFPGLAFFPLVSDPSKVLTSEEFRTAFFEGGKRRINPFLYNKIDPLLKRGDGSD